MAKNMHACAVVLGNKGIMITGPSGSGKSSLAFGLIAHFAHAGQFARWVGDDQILIDIKGQALIARAAATIAGQSEVHGFGIVSVDYEPQARIDLIVDLVEETDRMPDEQSPTTTLTAGKGRISLPSLHVARRNTSAAIEAVCASLSHRNRV